MTDDDPQVPGDPDDGLPEEIAEVLRQLTGGRDLPPQMVEQLRALGIADADPQQLHQMAAQVRAMFDPSTPTKGVDVASATRTARGLAAGEATPFGMGAPATEPADADDAGPRIGFRAPSAPADAPDAGPTDPAVGPRERTAVEEAVSLAAMWLDQATSLEAPTLRGAALSRAEWVEATMPVWASLVDPVADGLTSAIGTSLTTRLRDQGPIDPEQLQAMGLPPGFDAGALEAQIAPFVGRMASSLITVQLAHAVGTLAGDVLTGTEPAVPLLPEQVVLLPTNVAAFAEGLDTDLEEVRLHLAVRETARMRLFTAVPWLGPQILAAVQEYARGMAIDTDALDAAVQQIDPSDPAGLTEALGNGLFDPQPSAAQRAALTRLETWLALIEGWVDVVAGRATQPHLPHTAAMAETIRRRRATGGPAERTFAGLVGLELRPRRLRDAANLFAALEDRLGAAGRDGAWAHPDVAPDAGDLDDVLGYVERAAGRAGGGSGSDLDAELESLLRSAGDEGSGRPGGPDRPDNG